MSPLARQRPGEPRPFRPNGNPGGSELGKPQGRWPMVLKVVADAVMVRYQGSEEAMKGDRRGMPLDEFAASMDFYCPGWANWMHQRFGPRSTSYAELLMNRRYKMYYSGTSDRGPGHDPWTRAAESREHWRMHVPAGSPLHALHEYVVTGQRGPVSWGDYL